MVPAGAITDSVIDELAQTLEPGDTVIDGGNSYYRDDMRHAERLAKGGIRLLDCGTSGGVWGLGAWLQPDDRRRGRGLRAVVDHLDEVPGPAPSSTG
ncbi:MAG: NAD(P)-binding domain-containing protein [Nocardioidaceae bacterium]